MESAPSQCLPGPVRFSGMPANITGQELGIHRKGEARAFGLPSSALYLGNMGPKERSDFQELISQIS